VPPKQQQKFNELYIVELFITTDVRTSNPTKDERTYQMAPAVG
jgi:hypothetical protein